MRRTTREWPRLFTATSREGYDTSFSLHYLHVVGLFPSLLNFPHRYSKPPKTVLVQFLLPISNQLRLATL